LGSVRLLSVLFCLLCVGAAFAGCGAGLNGPVAVLPPIVAATPLPIPTQAPFSAAQSTAVTLPTAPPSGTPSTPVPVPLPSAGGYAPTLNLPLPVAATTATIAQQVTNSQPSTADSTVPVLSSGRSVLDVRSASDANRSVLLFVSLKFSSTITLSGAPAFTFTVPSAAIVPGANYFVAMFDPTNRAAGWQLGFEGPATINGTTLTFTGSTTPFTLVGGQTYYFALYATSRIVAPPTAAPTATPTATASPTSTPTATPTPTPTPGTPVASVTSMSFTQPGSTQTFTINETNYAGAFTVTSSNALVAAVSPSSGTASTTFTVTAGSVSGNSTITVTDANGHSSSFVATVTLTTVNIH
jgi:hypothetical protein